ncbi:ribonuclease P protein component [Bowdeniella nasicola]|uniref:Ribonuclease P protein component n=1 Tax=Bowdeniella nasicola TaxID=208480 RepID=A0A1Q5Q0B6_9ACTO|nr:ribonuclease P protein component [Bowdeniella nasicola]OKL53318.1 ribonuclease P protein component [Bowdeniella nasicola]
MLPAAHRLTRPEDFREVFRRGVSAGGSRVVLHWLRGDDSTRDLDPGAPVRIGFVASKKVGNAVMRHRVKRQLRHVMRERLEEFPPGARVVVRCLPAAAGSTSGDFACELDRLINKARERSGSR